MRDVLEGPEHFHAIFTFRRDSAHRDPTALGMTVSEEHNQNVRCVF
jgi:hypothetical protein